MSENVTRSISGICFIALLVSATLYSNITSSLLFSAFCLIAVYEFCNLVQLKKTVPMLLAAAYIAFSNLKYDGTQMFALSISTLVVSTILLLELFSKKDTTTKHPVSKYIKLMGYVIFPFLLIMHLPKLTAANDPRLIIGLFILIWTNDTFAYIFGKYLGKHKLFERVSPKKTIEGFVGGLVVACIVAYILSNYFTILNPTQWVITALIMSVFGTLGDLVESKFKRNANVKDSGKIMPGHGGILDRFDSIIFAVPFLYFIYYFIL